MKKNIISTTFVFVICLIFSIVAGYAQNVSAGILNSNSTFKSIIASVIGIFNNLIPLIIGAAVIVFLYGILVFIIKTSNGDVDGRKEGINFMIFGIIGIAVMVSVWGLVSFVTRTFGTSTSVMPQFNTR